MGLVAPTHERLTFAGSTFQGRVTFDAAVDAIGHQLLPQPATLRLAFVSGIDLTGATIAFAAAGTGPAATLPAAGPFAAGVDFEIASHKDRPVTYTITFASPLGPGAAMAMRVRSENFALHTFTGAADSFDIPMAGTRFEFGGAKGGFAGPGGASAGFGGRESGVLTLSSGLLVVNVGGVGTDGGLHVAAPGGWNGGGDGGLGTALMRYGAGGGGATDARYGGSALIHRIVVAAGGGGKGAGSGSTSGGTRGDAGHGGVDVGGDAEFGLLGGSSGYPGLGGTQFAGGADGGSFGTPGPVHAGLGRGGDGNGLSYNGGGGGGGGYYGGGGGGTTSGSTGGAGGGGGGSSFANLTYIASRVGERGAISSTLGGYAFFAWGFGDRYAGDELPGGGWSVGGVRTSPTWIGS